MTETNVMEKAGWVWDSCALMLVSQRMSTWGLAVMEISQPCYEIFIQTQRAHNAYCTLQVGIAGQYCDGTLVGLKN
jgi:hypothetical protein